MKHLGSALASLAVSALLTMSNSALANDRGHQEGKVTSILYSCNMDFRATGKSVYIGLGWSDIHGKGTISCYDLLHGTTEILPIKVSAKGPGAGVGVTGLVLSGAVAGVGVEKGPENLIGRYAVVRANAAAGVGAGVAAGLRVSKGGITVDVSVQAESGLGVGVDLLSLKIERDGDVKSESAQLPTKLPEVADAKQNRATPILDSAEVQENAPASTVVSGPVQTNTVYLDEGQPLQLVDSKGKVLQTIFLKPQSQD